MYLMFPSVFLRVSGSQVSPVVNTVVLTHVEFVHLLEWVYVINLPRNRIVGPIEYGVILQQLCEVIEHIDSPTS